VVDLSKGRRGKEPPGDPPNPPKADPDATSANTDMRFAQRLGDWHRNEIRYCAPWGVWLRWDGARWVRQTSKGGSEQEAAKKTARRLLQEAKERERKARTECERLSKQKTADGGPTPAAREAEEAKDVAVAVARGVRRAQSAAAIRDMLRLASSDPRLAVSPDELDKWPWELNVGNGIVDLRDGTLLAHARDQMHTKVAPVEYDPKSKCPRWEHFLAEVMGGNAEMVAYLQKLAGYSLTGSTREQVLHFHFGDGANGKSTYLRTLSDILGDYATVAARNLLFLSRATHHDTRFAALHGARMVLCNEVEEGLSFDEALVKDLCSEDRISGRRMREDLWSFVPRFTLHAAGQHKPAIKGDDNGIWRRMRLVPWLVSIPPERRDKDLLGKLWEERAGILAWAVRGAVVWQTEGLGMPDAIARATQSYRQESDIVGQFFGEHVRLDSKSQVPVGKMRKAYTDFCETIGAEPLGAKRFAQRLQSFGAGSGSGRDDGVKTRTWTGVRVL
jgi:putative DNA primase/helicase